MSSNDTSRSSQIVAKVKCIMTYSYIAGAHTYQFADLKTVMSDAIKQYAEDVRNQNYPNDKEAYEMPADVATQLEKSLTVDENEIPYVIYAD